MTMFHGFKLQRWGRSLSIVTGRLGVPWGLHVIIRVLPAWGLIGVYWGRDDDEQDEGYQLLVGVGFLAAEIRAIHYLTKKAVARKKAEVAAFMADIVQRREEATHL